jgi:uncharacterized protein (DUF1330 family)
VSAYVIAQLPIHDRSTYEEYASGAPATLEPYGGTVGVTRPERGRS